MAHAVVQTAGDMQLGFTMLEVGSVRVFHVSNILIKVRADMSLCTMRAPLIPCNN